ncbi:MAG: hypothetical protein FWE86_01375 [Oscillospiraceae bacterium]|nr:hypothetical protein [Oscillospiraceae bacterium]
MAFDAQLRILNDYFSIGVDDYAWRVLQDDETAAVGEEARREIGSDHPLFGVGLTALAKCSVNNEALFAMEGGYYALVHLTYRAENDAHMPRFTLFENFGGALDYIRTEFPFADF